MYFEKAGAENTEQTLQIARDEALARGIKTILIATTYGDTGLKAAQMLKGSPVKLVAITHNTGFSEPGQQQLKQELKREIELLGGIIFTGTMVLRNIGTAVKGKAGYSQEQLIADTLRMFCQGLKVCVEIAAIAADAGLVSTEDVIVVAGTGRGADTAVILTPKSSNQLFDIRIREILCKPKNF
ncbi:MAG: hypothetical protein HY730_03910 [Candidatus Tectomicrobia bacterium]|uniref:Pyruvate kinase C-terminal domain-containing protein n=1 Tax=Tectimicrobiota bacterium TaxID=2528274 RepID=A0A933GKG4_UNCTE|nr:hypothetical protein [Candidatus Tectomicrobia bacterium]